jgi:hypothetical protein
MKLLSPAVSTYIEAFAYTYLIIPGGVSRRFSCGGDPAYQRYLSAFYSRPMRSSMITISKINSTLVAWAVAPQLRRHDSKRLDAAEDHVKILESAIFGAQSI